MATLVSKQILACTVSPHLRGKVNDGSSSTTKPMWLIIWNCTRNICMPPYLCHHCFELVFSLYLENSHAPASAVGLIWLHVPFTQNAFFQYFSPVEGKSWQKWTCFPHLPKSSNLRQGLPKPKLLTSHAISSSVPICSSSWRILKEDCCGSQAGIFDAWFKKFNFSK